LANAGIADTIDTMLREIRDARQVAGEGRRRWFSDDYLDLVVWHAGDDVTGFQLTYDLGGSPRAITWDWKNGYLHTGVDDGEEAGRMKKSPILVADGVLDRDRLVGEFRARSRGMERPLALFVLEKLAACDG
jgi:hypothetical protein